MKKKNDSEKKNDSDNDSVMTTTLTYTVLAGT